jgi:tetratricopeptide (TPR) repeat protein
MSDKPRERFEGLADLDWDNALDEWEKSTFVPEIARDANPPATQEEAARASAAPAPPPTTPAIGEEPVAPRPPTTPRSSIASPSVSFAPPGARASAPPSMRGGLDQLFSRSIRPSGLPAEPHAGLPIIERDEESASGQTRQIETDGEAGGTDADKPPSLVDSDERNAVFTESTRTSNLPPEWFSNLEANLRFSEPPTAAPDPYLNDPADTGVLRKPEHNVHETVTVSDRLPADDEMPTLARPSSIPAGRRPSMPVPGLGEPRPVLPTVPAFEGERPAAGWLDDEKVRAIADRIVWLEDEARSLENVTAQARALLALSELCALVGDTSRAFAFAIEARDIAPDLPLPWRQARHLMGRDEGALAEALTAEGVRSPTPAARAHAMLLAADVLRIHDRGDAAVERWESACKLDPTDIRAPMALAALALAQDAHSSAALRVGDNSELVALDKAIATALRLRGVERPNVDVDPMPINDGLRHTRKALASDDILAATQSALEIATVPELAKGARWLSAALGAVRIGARRITARSLKTLAAEGDLFARRQLAARGLELADPEMVSAAAEDEAAFAPAERAVLHALVPRGAEESAASADPLASLDGDPTASALVDAVSALASSAGDEADASRRAHRVVGTEAARADAALGRLLAANASPAAIESVLARTVDAQSASAGGVAIETAVRAKRWSDLSEALGRLPASDVDAGAFQRHVAAALIAERAHDDVRAKLAWTAAASSSVSAEGLARIAAELDGEFDLGAALLRLADEMPDGVASAILRLEAVVRTELDESEEAAVLERAHRSLPGLGIATFLAEHLARRQGDVEEVVRWIHERSAYVTEPFERALDAVREALLVAEFDPTLAGERLEEAHRVRPDDVALAELHERLASEPVESGGLPWEKRAEATSGAAAASLWLEAALEHERSGDAAATLRTARLANEAGDRGLSRPLILRAQLASGNIAELAGHLTEVVDTATSAIVRRDALERLADLDSHVRKDPGAALARHRAILESDPRHKASLRRVEHALVTEGQDDELAPIFEQIALALDGTGGGETSAHAQHAARLFARTAQSNATESSYLGERTDEMARVGARQPEPSLWSLRALNAYARSQKDDEALFDTSVALVERTQRPAERATLLLRASEAAARGGRSEAARAFAEQAASEDAGDVVTWGLLAEHRQSMGDAALAAEACESLARASNVPDHQLLAWHDAARIWLEIVEDKDRAMVAFEAAAEIDVTYAEVFTHLSALYAQNKRDADLARLLERRLERVDNEDERVTLEVELGRAFADLGDLDRAKACLSSAIAKRPDHTSALGAIADVCMRAGDWNGAEQASVRLARLLSDPAEQRVIYETLGEIYSVHAPNLSRAEVAFKEILKRAPGDVGVLAKLVDVYKRQADVASAVDAQQEIINAVTEPEARLAAQVELASIYETVGRDPRKTERVLESARREFPTSVVALRALAEFYARQRQMPAMQILLDRAAADARRAFAQGRFVPSLFQVLHAAFELRGKRDAAAVVAATLAAVEGQPSRLAGVEALAIDPRLDDLTAPDLISPALRTLLQRTGATLDAVANVDLRVLAAKPLPSGTSIGSTIGAVATVIGLGSLQILVSPHLDRVALPLSSNPPTLLIGEGLARAKNEPARVFVVVRALKMLVAQASGMVRAKPEEVSLLIAGLFTALNPTFVPQGLDSKKVAEIARRIEPALPKNLDSTAAVLALEAAGTIGGSWANLGLAAHGWANRVGLLAVGDPNAALDAIAWAHEEDSPPSGSEERAAWIARHTDARELMTFSVTDAYAEARIRASLDR